MIKEVCLVGKNTETYEEAIGQTFHIDLYTGFFFRITSLQILNFHG
jgi:hypothetical protein